MKAIEGYVLISPDDLHWRPSNLMRIPNADYLEHAAQARSAGGILFCSGRPGPNARRRRDLERAEIRRRAGWARPITSGIQRHRRRGALAHHRSTGGTGIS